MMSGPRALVASVLRPHRPSKTGNTPQALQPRVDPSGAPNCPAGCIPSDLPETASCSRAWLADLTLVDVDRKDLLGGGGLKKADPRSSRRADAQSVLNCING